MMGISRQAADACLSAGDTGVPHTRWAVAGFGASLVTGLLALAALSPVLPGVAEAGMAERLSASLAAFGPLGAVLLVAALACSVVIGPVPTAPFAVAAGMLYGAGVGAALALAGGLLGAVLAFLIARMAGRPLVGRLAERLPTPRWLQGDHSLFRLVLVARLVPVLSFALVSYAAGLSAISLRAFALATVLGMAPMTLLCATLGSSVETGSYWVAAGVALVLPALVLYPALERRGASIRPWKGPRNGSSGAST